PLVSCRPTGVGASSAGPLAHRVGGAAARMGKYSAMGAQAEQSARTQAEIDAEFASAEDVIDARAGDHRWWLTEKLTYSAPRAVSVRETEGRVARAILTDGIRGRFGGPRGLSETSSALAGLV